MKRHSLEEYPEKYGERFYAQDTFIHARGRMDVPPKASGHLFKDILTDASDQSWDLPRTEYNKEGQVVNKTTFSMFSNPAWIAAISAIVATSNDRVTRVRVHVYSDGWHDCQAAELAALDKVKSIVAQRG